MNGIGPQGRRISQYGRRQRKQKGIQKNLKDEGDNHVVELAVAGRAEMIVTRNLRDFLNMELRFPALRICSPEEFLKGLRT